MANRQEQFPLDAAAGPARQIDEAAAQAIVNGALDEVFAKAPVVARRPRPRLLWAAAVLLIIVSSGASAAWLYRRVRAQKAKAAPAPQTAPARKVEPAPAILIEVPEPEAPALKPPPRKKQARAKRVSIDTLLQTANRLRGNGDYRGAERTYLKVLSRAPTSDAAYVAAASAATLRSEKLGRPKAAVGLFQRARKLRPGGALDAEILLGLADAHRRLSNAPAEAKTLRDLIGSHPRSAYAKRAHVRLEELKR